MRNEVVQYGCFDSEFLKLLISRDVPSTSNKLGKESAALEHGAIW